MSLFSSPRVYYPAAGELLHIAKFKCLLGIINRRTIFPFLRCWTNCNPIYNCFCLADKGSVPAGPLEHTIEFFLTVGTLSLPSNVVARNYYISMLHNPTFVGLS